MGLPWFANRKNAPVESPRRRSQGWNIFSKPRREKSPSSKKTSALSCREKSSRSNIFTGKSCSLASTAELEAVFNKFDANGDGKISLSELGHVMRALGHDASEEELRLMMAEADTDGDGCVNLPEFVALNTKGVDSAARLQDLKDAFKMFDMDGDGSISVHELHNILTRLEESHSLDECRRMIKGVDADGDGQVSFDEFLAMMSAPNGR